MSDNSQEDLLKQLMMIKMAKNMDGPQNPIFEVFKYLTQQNERLLTLVIELSHAKAIKENDTGDQFFALQSRIIQLEQENERLKRESYIKKESENLQHIAEEVIGQDPFGPSEESR